MIAFMNLTQYIAKTDAKKADMARALRVSPALLHQWVEGIRPVAIKHCQAIEDLTGGNVTRKDLRPNDWRLIWPDLGASTRRATDPKPQPARAGRRPIDASKIMTVATAQPRTYTRKP